MKTDSAVLLETIPGVVGKALVTSTINGFKVYMDGEGVWRTQYSLNAATNILVPTGIAFGFNEAKVIAMLANRLNGAYLRKEQ